MLVLHIWAAIKLSSENKAARPVGYAEWNPVGSTYASRTMLMSGLIVFVFIIYHLLHFTLQNQAVNFLSDPQLANFKHLEDPAKRHDIFSMMVAGFSNIWVSGFYVLGIALLCLHLSHGVSAMFQSIGWKNRTYGPILDKGSRILAGLIFVGYISIPIAVLCGYGGKELEMRKAGRSESVISVPVLKWP
jgi:succinate dehydrogenase / fumarate reductase cytochrome b subunit